MYIAMNLGRAKLRRNKRNFLFQAVHPKHGFIWTNGTTAFQSQFSCIGGTISVEKTVQLGEFNSDVYGLGWSADTLCNQCYIAVQLQSKIGIWKVQLIVDAFKLTEILEIKRENLLPHGFVWHPSLPVLCVLTKSKVEIFHIETPQEYNLHCGHAISGGLWMKGGEKLVISDGASLVVCNFTDLRTSIKDVKIVEWEVPNIDGKICSMDVIDCNQLVITSNLPLDRLISHCKLDMFEATDVPHDISDGLCSSKHSDTKKVNLSTATLHKELDVTKKGPIDLTALIVGKKEESASNKVVTTVLGDEVEMKTPSVEHGEDIETLEITGEDNVEGSLFKLKRTKLPKLQDSSQLLMISLDGVEPTIIHRVNIPGILEPDIITCHSEKLIAVSSSAHHSIEVFGIQETKLRKVDHIDLGCEIKVKGLHYMLKSTDLLVMSGKPDCMNTSFPPSGIHTWYDLSLSICQKHTMPTGNTKMSLSTMKLHVNSNETRSPLVEEIVVPEQVSSIGSENGTATNTYPGINDIEIIQVIRADDITKKKNFLLNNGLLQLDAVKKAFKLPIVMLVNDKGHIVLTSDSQGYIPIDFTKNKSSQGYPTILIMDGRKD